MQYNNYYNRIVKRENDLPGYINAGTAIQSLSMINFNPGDGINTTHVVNIDVTFGDYLLVTDGFQEVYSRWFITKTTRTLRGQYIMTLRRDIIADKLSSVLATECFIEKGIVSDDDPAIFNAEDMTFSQIKQLQIPLMDDSQCAWIVGYYARQSGEAITELSGEFDAGVGADITLSTPITEWEEYQYVGASTPDTQFKGYPRELVYMARVRNAAYQRYYFQMRDIIDQINAVIDTPSAPSSTDGYYQINNNISQFVSDVLGPFGNNRSILRNQAATISSFESQARTLEFVNYDNKIISDSTGKYYKISVIRNDTSYHRTTSAGSLFNTLDGILKNAGAYTPGAVEWTITYKLPRYSLSLQEVLAPKLTSYSITSNRVHAQDAPYDVFAIPYSDNLTLGLPDVPARETRKDVAFNTAMHIANKYGGASGVLYDLQLLPYCPIIEKVIQEKQINPGRDLKYYSLIKQGADTVGIIFNLDHTQFVTTIAPTLPVIQNVKIDSQTVFARICSPNYAGVFEITPAKTGGLSPITISCTYKPYNPYIQVTPHFGRLYGQNFKDARGLICGGDFSLPVVNDQWSAYEIQHKNYAAIFDRQIENMEVVNNANRERERWQLAAGTVNGALAGMNVGIQSGGGGWGAAAGAAAGGAFSLAGGLRDIELNEQLRGEAIDFARDQFGYNLGNIRALPNTLNKVSAFTITNQLFPFIEIYGCPMEESLALANKIKYNGMTVGRIGMISDYVKPWSYTTQGETVDVRLVYIKAKIIRFNGGEDDLTIANAIAAELNRGIFIDAYADTGSN